VSALQDFLRPHFTEQKAPTRCSASIAGEAREPSYFIELSQNGDVYSQPLVAFQAQPDQIEFAML
jgi:hypothetical protein